MTLTIVALVVAMLVIIDCNREMLVATLTVMRLQFLAE